LTQGVTVEVTLGFPSPNPEDETEDVAEDKVREREFFIDNLLVRVHHID